MRMLSEHRSRSSTAVLGVNSGLDLDTVLHEIVKSTRGQTGVRYDVISNIDEAEQRRTSSPLVRIRMKSSC